jgi:dTDP-glucose 4,6-dehydratase
LTRDPGAFRAAFPSLAGDAAVRLVAGDVRTFTPNFGVADAVIHAATPASARVNEDEPEIMLSTILDGGRNVLAFAERCGDVPVLFTSSGAVYGRQPPDLAGIDEEYTVAPDPLAVRNAYYEGKRSAEIQCALAARGGVQPKIARLFAFVGPYLPLDRHFAIGNFIRDALAEGDIAVSGDGSALRSYLYAADMAIWLWRIFARGRSLRPYNVGSEIAIAIGGAAQRVASASISGRTTIARIPDSSVAPERYIPNTLRARTELNLAQWTSLDEGIRRTLAWHRAGAQSNRSRPCVRL